MHFELPFYVINGIILFLFKATSHESFDNIHGPKGINKNSHAFNMGNFALKYNEQVALCHSCCLRKLTGVKANS